MRALIYKDLLTIRRTMKGSLLLVAAVCIVPITNISLNALWLVCGWSLALSLFTYDGRDKWDVTQAVLPYSSLSIVLSRYLMGWLSTAFAAGCFLLGQLALFPAKEPGYVFTVLGLFSAMGLFYQALLFPWIFHLGIQRSKDLLFGLAFAIAFLGYIVWSTVGFLLYEFSAAVLGPLLTIPLSVLSVLLAVRLYDRRSDPPRPGDD